MSKLKKHLTPSTFIALIALVFAVTGVSFAATGGGSSGSGAKATASLSAGGAGGSAIATTAKKKAAPKGKAGPRGPAGAKGATGATGATGAAGATGPGGPAGGAGPAGGPGPTGNNGTSVTTTPIASGSECKEGGVKLTPGGKICNGEKGTTGYTAVLPPGQSEHGVFGFHYPEDEGEGTEIVPISFPIKLPAALEEANVHIVEFRRNEGRMRRQLRKSRSRTR